MQSVEQGVRQLTKRETARMAKPEEGKGRWESSGQSDAQVFWNPDFVGVTLGCIGSRVPWSPKFWASDKTRCFADRTNFWSIQSVIY